MDNMNQRNTFSTNGIFENGFLYGKALYLYCFNVIPSINYMSRIDGEKAFSMLKEKFPGLIESVHSYRWYDQQKKAYEFDETFVIMKNRCILEFDTDYCEIFHDGTQDEFIQECAASMKQFKQRQRRKPLEINLVTSGRNGLELKGLEIKRTQLNLDLYYEDEFKKVNEVICKRLSCAKDKGLVLLHGLPGTGKTTYLRYMIGKIKKKVLFLSPGVAKDIMNPEFVQLLINNPDSVIIIEDAENIIMDRRYSSTSSVSALLNIADGLMADFLNVQIVCTFNSPLTMVDTALMRQGRLIAQRLSKHFGFDNLVTEPMTIAELAHQHEAKYEAKQVEVMGFRRQATVLN
jgi:ATPase family associated with various cellular activities (AAA)